MEYEANRDAYGAGRDQVVVNVSTGAEPPRERERAARVGMTPGPDAAFTGREELLGMSGAGRAAF